MINIAKIATGSGFCADNVHFLKLYLAALQIPAFRPIAIAMRIKFSPDILEKIRRCRLTVDEKAALFSRSMTLFKSGSAYKTTAPGRSLLTDKAIIEKSRPGDIIVETGVSDGVSALGLLEKAKTARIILTDSQEAFFYKDFPGGRIFYDRDGYIGLKVLFFYLCSGLRAGERPSGCGSVSLLNPLIAKRFGTEIIRFDIFSGVLPQPADIIKCANVLNTVYFSPEEIDRGLLNLARSLKDGGWIFVCQNNKKYRDGEAYFSLRKRNGLLELREQVNGHEMLPHLKSVVRANVIQ